MNINRNGRIHGYHAIANANPDLKLVIINESGLEMHDIIGWEFNAEDTDGTCLDDNFSHGKPVLILKRPICPGEMVFVYNEHTGNATLTYGGVGCRTFENLAEAEREWRLITWGPDYE
jgi:hypothetical protein